jgi:DNA polymerase-3 subunit alpha
MKSDCLENLASLLKDSPGVIPVYIVVKINQQKVLLSTSNQFSIQMNQRLEQKLKKNSIIKDYILS